MKVQVKNLHEPHKLPTSEIFLKFQAEDDTKGQPYYQVPTHFPNVSKRNQQSNRRHALVHNKSMKTSGAESLLVYKTTT